LRRYNSTTPSVKIFFKLMYSSKNILGVYFVKYF
jgi:hypothetical protein